MTEGKLIKASIITVCYNSSKTILENIRSVNDQSHKNIEHIFIDGDSDDDTLEIIKKNSVRDLKLISEKDKGIYDAMNKGVKVANGDFICFLNSDDVYTNEFVIAEVAQSFSKKNVDLVFGNIKYVDKRNNFIRSFNSPNKFNDVLKGHQIPHPAFFLKTNIAKKLEGPFDVSYKISSDFKQQIFLAYNYDLKFFKLNKTLVNMRTGGASNKSFFNRFIGWREVLDSYKELTGQNGIFLLLKKIIINFSGLMKSR